MAVDTERRIMVIDDDLTILDLMIRMLLALGFDATPFGSGIEALKRFGRDHFQLVLTDLQMPVIDGWELARCIKNERPWIPVIAVTGQGREAVLEKLGGSGIEGVLFKPFSMEQLDQVIHTAMARTQPPAVSGRLAPMEA